jgi:prepilin-type N-terminal cleavage/methylation domain-containing protein
MIASRASNRGLTVIELLLVVTVGAVLMAVGTPLLRGAMVEQRLNASATDVSSALSEARREAFRTGEVARVELDPTDGRISVFSRNVETGVVVERRRLYLPNGVVFNNVAAATNYTFDTLGRPATLPMTVQVRSVVTDAVRTVVVLGSGQVSIT